MRITEALEVIAPHLGDAACIHSNGDREIEMVLTAIERLR